MLQFSDYEVYIFDCDGVILDSNQLKIDAMKAALEKAILDPKIVESCVDYFSKNFGRSRFHHVDVFIENFIGLKGDASNSLREQLLKDYSTQCKKLYLTANVTPGFFELLNQLEGVKYVASGSEQEELREIFETRKFNSCFKNIFGSPAKKSQLLKNILEAENNKKAIMIGDALSDLESALTNNIDFIGYLPFSNVASELQEQAQFAGFNVIQNWEELKGEQ
jgi:phosphoglycolate phosphatase-like HAD superfamily hydrolase